MGNYLDNNKDIQFDVKMGNPLYNYISNLWGNHLIVIVSYGLKHYILDPTNNDIYYFKDNNPYDEYGNLVVIKKSMARRAFNASVDRIDHILNLPTGNLIDESKKIEYICQSKEDILDKFKENNKELFSDVDKGIKEYKKKRR